MAYNRTGQWQDLLTKRLVESADWLEKRVRFSVLSAAELTRPWPQNSHKAIADWFHAVLVDNGVMHLNECEQVQKTLTEHLGTNLTVANASQQFLDGLKGIGDPEEKRNFIGGKFIDVFEEEAKKIEDAATTFC